MKNIPNVAMRTFETHVTAAKIAPRDCRSNRLQGTRNNTGNPKTPNGIHTLARNL